MKAKRSKNEIVIDRVNNSSWLGVKAKMTPVSLTLPKGLTHEQWAAIGPRIARIKRFTSWALSDWLNAGEQRWGEMYSQAADATGFEPNYLAIVKYVGSAVDPSRRRESLSFSHHRLVASLEPKDQEKFLRDAEKNSWSREDLHQAILEFKGPNGRSNTVKKLFPSVQDDSPKAESTDEQDEEIEAELQRKREEILSEPTPPEYRRLDAASFKEKIEAVIPTLGDILVELRDLYNHLPEKNNLENDKYGRASDLADCILLVQGTADRLSHIESLYRWAVKRRQDNLMR